MLEPAVAAWIALGVGIGATLVVSVAAFGLVRQWRATRRTQLAASALLDVHRERIEASIDTVAAQAQRVGNHGAELADSVEELRGDVRHLTWLLGRIPEAKDTLRETLLDIVLPTAPRGDAAKERSRERA